MFVPHPLYSNYVNLCIDDIASKLLYQQNLVSMTTISWLMMSKEIIAVYYENHTKHINTLCVQNAELLIVQAGGVGLCGYHWVLKC
jgi:hypothetical protein